MDLINDYKTAQGGNYLPLKFEVVCKKYPQSIMQGAKIVDSMRLFIYWNGWQFTSGRLDAQCNDEVFNLHIENLKENMDNIILWIKKENVEILPF